MRERDSRTDRRSEGPLEGSPRILITRLSAIGDCILTMPLAVALRQAYPQAFIAWAVEGVAGTMIERHSAINLAIRLPRRFARSPLALWRLRQRLKALRFDVALDPQSLTKSALVAWLSGAPRRIGFARPVGRELAPWLHHESCASKQTHVVDRYLELLRPLGITPGPARFDFPSDAATESNVSQALQLQGVSRPFAVLNPGAGWRSKQWPIDRYADVARQLQHRFGMAAVVTWAGAEERGMAEEISRLSGGSGRIAPPTSLLELGAILRQARLFVGSDTGPLHLAAAVGAPCVGIYGPTRPEDCGPYGIGHETLQAWHQTGTSRQRRAGGNDAMRDVPAEWVIAACERILATPTSLPAA